jgi:hypothetical protein
MVRRGSPVRVRKRALGKPSKCGAVALPVVALLPVWIGMEQLWNNRMKNASIFVV